MRLTRRRLLGLAAGTALPRIARAQSYPDRSVRLLVGFPPGGQVDIVARLTAQFLSERLGQTVVVENRPGAGGTIGAEAIVKAPPDGYTLFFASASNTVNATLFEHLNYDFVRDIAPISPVNRITLVVEANPSFALQTMGDIIGYAKANPGMLTVASPSAGTPPYMAVELLKMLAGIDLVHVPYAGEGQMVTDLLGGQLQVGIGGLSPSIGHMRAGKLRALAVALPARSDLVPDVPTVGETVPGYEASGWSGIVAPRDTPAASVATLYQAVRGVQADPKFKERLADLGSSVLAMAPADFGAFIAEETEKWGKVVKFAGLKPQ